MEGLTGVFMVVEAARPSFAERCQLAATSGICAAFVVGMLGAAFSAALTAQSNGAGLRTLATVAEVSHLSAEDAAKSYPVHLKGVVTFCDLHLKSGHAALFFHDATGSLYVDVPPGVTAGTLAAGAVVELDGVSDPGGFSPILMATKARVEGTSALPPSPLLVLPRIPTGDNSWVEVEGVVRSVEESDTLIKLQLALTDRTITAQTLREPEATYNALVDAKVRIRANASPLYNQNRQIIGARLLFPNLAALSVVTPAPSDPFALPVHPIDGLFRFRMGEATEHRVHLRGTVTLQWPGKLLCIRDATGGLCAQTTQADAIPLGSSVDLMGFAAMGDIAPILTDAAVRIAGGAEPVVAEAITAEQAMQGLHNSKLVQIDGVILGRDKGSADTVMVIASGKYIYEASLPKGLPEGQVGAWQVGSTVRLTGICSVLIDSEKTARGAGLEVPKSFRILLRSAADVAVLRRPSWWNTLHLLWILAVFSAGMVVVVLWVVVLRKRVDGQTKTIRESEERFRNLAQHDALTGLPNRLLLDERIAACLLRTKERHHRAAVLTIDIDRFKHINDTYGHPAGDECLRVVASRLRNAAQEIDTIARTGGEEFTLVAAGLRDRDDADRIATSILDLFHDPVVLGELEIVVTVSVGCAMYPDDSVEREELLKRSDQALYEAKRTGRNRVVFATTELCAKFERTSAIEMAVRESIRVGAFSLAYQPIYDTAGELQCLEALLRSTDEQLSAVGPAVYVPIAESCGLILPLGRSVLQAVCRHIAAWQASGLHVCPVAVNLSASQLLQNGFSEDVLQILESYNLPPSALQFELTEAAAMTEFDAVLKTVTRLAQAGVAFAIDEYGTGSSSIARLYQLPIKSLKINRAFVQSIEESSGSHTVMKAVIKMAPSLNLLMVGVGVERPEQLDLLRDYGCDLFQGHLLGRPMPTAEVGALLAQNAAGVLATAS